MYPTMSSIRSVLVLCLCALVTAQSASQPDLSPILSRQTALCNQTSEWSLTLESYAQANTDGNLRQLLADATARGQRFDDALGDILGYNDFKCGIGLGASCQIGSCFGQPCLDAMVATY